MASRELNTRESDLIRRTGGHSSVKGTVKIISYLKYDKRRSSKPRYYLLSPVIIGGIFYDHLWIASNKHLVKQKLQIGDTLRLEGRIHVYHRYLDSTLNIENCYNGKICVNKPYRNVEIFRSYVNCYETFLKTYIL